MSNMSYCRFENTLEDLRDCRDNLTDPELSKEEFKARKKLIKVCREIVEDAETEDLEAEEYKEPTD